MRAGTAFEDDEYVRNCWSGHPRFGWQNEDEDAAAQPEEENEDEAGFDSSSEDGN